MLEALERLARTPGQEHLLPALRRHAPMWLLQMPSLLAPDERAELQRQLVGTARQRMLREMGTLLDVLTAEHPLVLVLEDLHWSDQATVQLLAYLARRQGTARVLLAGTYRPTELRSGQQTLEEILHELHTHNKCCELTLAPLSESTVVAYLTRRFPSRAIPVRLPHFLYERSEGNPLFLVSLVDDLVARGVGGEVGGGWDSQAPLSEIEVSIPESLRHLLAKQRQQLTAVDSQMLEAASVAGAEFSAAVVAAALDTESVKIEYQAEILSERQQFLCRAGVEEWPDGTIAARYRFQHSLYQLFWHEYVTPSVRQQWHQRIGLRKEVAYNGRASEIAAELAVHFEEGHDLHRALRYHQHGARNALQRHAYQESLGHLTRGRQLLQQLPPTEERTHQELQILLILDSVLIATKGYGALEVEQTYGRALVIGQQMEQTPQLLQVLWGLESFYAVRGKCQMARQLGEQCLQLARGLNDPARLLQAHWTLGHVISHMGDFVIAQQHLQNAIEIYLPHYHRPTTLQDPGVTSLVYLASVLWMLGYPDQAVVKVHVALQLADELAHLFSKAFALTIAVEIAYLRGELEVAQTTAEMTIAFCIEHGFSHWSGVSTIFLGRVLCAQGKNAEGMPHLQQGIKMQRATGAESSLPWMLAFLAEAYGQSGQLSEGMQLLEEAVVMVEQNEERYIEADLYRLKGELTLLQVRQKLKVKGQKSKVTDPRSLNPEPHAEAEACFLKAIEIAQKQHAKSWELRATLSLARLWQQQGKAREAYLMLSTVYNWFTEGFDTKDLQEAKALLNSLGSNA